MMSVFILENAPDNNKNKKISHIRESQSTLFDYVTIRVGARNK